MKKSENYQFNMHLSVQSVCNQYATVLATITAYVNAKLKLDNSIALEQEVAEKQEVYKTYSSAPKNEDRAVASTPLLDLSSKIMSYALNKGNTALYLDVKLTKTALDKVNDQQFILIHKKILGAAQDNLDDLTDYQVTEQTITANNAFLATFKNEIKILEERKSIYNQCTLELSKEIKATKLVLKPIDSIVNSMRVSQPKLFTQYWNARTIKKTAGSKIMFKGKVYDAVTNQPLPGAMVTLMLVSNSKSLTSGAELVKNVKVKSAGGGFQLKSIPDGNYMVTVSYYGYADLQVPAYVNNGILTLVQLPLTKLPE